MLNKTIGSIFILIGSAIGAGMLALPIVGAQAGFYYSSILLVLIWILMTLTALLTLEVNLAFDSYRNSFSTMARATLGRSGQIIAWIAYLFLLYATTASYIAGNTSLLDELLRSFLHIKIPAQVNAIMFTIVFGSAVFLSTRAVDYFSRVLLTVKGILLVIMLAALLPYVDIQKIHTQEYSSSYLLIAAPIFLNAFGFHFVIPSISNYCHKQVNVLRRVIIISTTIPLIIYIIWLFVAFGIIPIHGDLSFASVAEEHSSVGRFVHVLGMIVNNKYVWFGVNGFSNIAMTTSFLGVSLGLFDFLADGLKRANNHFGRMQTSLLTFIPPLLFALFYKDAFIVALEYSAFFAVVLEIFLPALMVYKLRLDKKLQSPYRVPINSKLMLVVLMVIGCALMLIIIANRLGLFLH